MFFLVPLFFSTEANCYFFHPLLRDLNRCNYCENGTVMNSNQYLILESLSCYLFTPVGLNLSNLGISYYPSSRSSSRLFLSSPANVGQLDLVKLRQAKVKHNLL